MVAEIANDPDKGITNTYYYKDADPADPKFYMGPVWDYDNRFGGTTNHSSAEILTGLASGGWIRDLYERPEFREAVRREWNSFFRDYLTKDAPENIGRWHEQIRKSVMMDNVRWFRGTGYPRTWPRGDGNFTDDYDFDEAAEYLKGWIRTRCEFLDGCWSGN